MIKTVGIVSLSSGIIGESFIRHEFDIGIRRLREYGLNVRFMPHALMGLDYIKAHPEKRAEDLLQAFRDPEIDMILCAIGGDDTYRLLPYLFDHNELADAVTDKVFLGFSDTTINHLMLHKVGLNTFYGQAFLPDICELSPEMHPYTRHYFEELMITICSLRQRTGKDISCCWNPVKKSLLRKSIGRRLNTLRREACLTRFPAYWLESLWMRPMRRNIGSCLFGLSISQTCRLFST